MSSVIIHKRYHHEKFPAGSRRGLGNGSIWKIFSIPILLLILAGFLHRSGSAWKNYLKETARHIFEYELRESILEQYMPVAAMGGTQNGGYTNFIMDQVENLMPIYGYSLEEEKKLVARAFRDAAKDELSSGGEYRDSRMDRGSKSGEMRDFSHEWESTGDEENPGGKEYAEPADRRQSEKEDAPKNTGEKSTENGREAPGDDTGVKDGIEIREIKEITLEELEARALEENRTASQDGNADSPRDKEGQEGSNAGNPDSMEIQITEAENGEGGAFLARTQRIPVDLEELQDFQILVNRFYTIDENTMSDGGELNVNEFLEKDLSIDKNVDGPQILIYHTHSQEAYADSVPGDESMTVMGMGDRLTEILTEEYGYQVLHHRGKYDVESRDYAYSNALPDIERILKDNPTIQVVIDLHRDAVPDHVKLSMEVDGRPTARYMFFNGLSRTKQTGDIAYLRNDNLQDNLAFSFQMQLMSESYYPGLARRIYLKGYRYNMHLKPRNMLIELGAQNNTVEEARNACDIIAFLLDRVLSGE